MTQPVFPPVIEQEEAALAELVHCFEHARASYGVPSLEAMRDALVRRAMRLSRSKTAAAKALGVDRRTFHRMIARMRAREVKA